MFDIDKSPEAVAVLDKVEDAARTTPPKESAAEPAAAPVRTGIPLRAKVSGLRRYPLAGIAAAVLAIVALVLGYAWHSTSNDLNALKTSNSDRDRAAEIARDYTLRSLTYDYKNLPAFFDGVERGTSEALKDRYTQVHDTLAKIMTDAQVVATGQVAGTSVEARGNGQYEVTVYATQRTQNIQQPDPATVPNLLVLTVAKDDGQWLVTDYGPKDPAPAKDPAAAKNPANAPAPANNPAPSANPAPSTDPAANGAAK